MSRKIVILGYSRSVHINRWARSLAARGYKMTVISLGGGEIDNVETINLPPGKNRNLGYLKCTGKVKKLVHDIKPDLLHAHYATGFGLWGWRSKFHPYLVSVWGADVIDFPDNYLKKTLVRKILNSADRITATSQFLKDQTLQLVPELDTLTDVIPFGVDIPQKTKYDRDDDLIKLAFIKVHYKKYGPDLLIRAFDRALKANRRLRLIMAGEGEMTPYLKELVNRMNLNEYVTFTGFIENTKMAEFLAGHDIMVMPSVLDSETFGVAVLEAAAVGLPVIASNVGGVPGVMKDGETGLLVPPGDITELAGAIIKLADDVELRIKMGEAGRKFTAENYLWDKCLDRMSELYEKIIAGKDRN